MGLHSGAGIVAILGISLAVAGAAFGAPEPLKPVKELWQAKLGALVTDLDVTPDGKRILLSMRSDADAAPAEPSAIRPLPAKGAYTVLIDGQGKELWRKRSEYPIKSQAISETGDRAIVVTYDNRFMVYDGAGKKLWQLQSNCLPRALVATKRVFCFHDDDSDPAIAFEIYDWNGKKLGDWKTPGADSDLLAVSFNEARTGDAAFAVNYSDGHVEVFRADGTRIHRAKLPGEVLDVSFGPGGDGKVLVLAQERSGSSVRKRLVSLAADGKPEFSEEVRDPAQQVLSMLPKRFVLTANAKDGQTYRLFALGNPSPRSRAVDLVSQVKYAQQTAVSYPVRHLGDGFVFVLEKLVKDDRVSQVSWIGADGQTLADWPLTGEKGAYLYAFDLAPKARTVVIAMDDGTVKVAKF